MEKEIKDGKSCKNCRYYSQHYSIQGTRYNTVCCGHCMNRDNKKRHCKKADPYEVCEYWESVEIQKEERKRSIKETLEFMAERLDEMAEILKDDIE